MTVKAADPTAPGVRPITGAPADARWFRHVLGHFPTGVVVITAHGPEGPVGMAVGSFTSVSLDPPLVAFLPDRNSSTYAAIRHAGSFCVNVLSADQAELCRQFARSGADKYAGVTWEPSEHSGAPRISNVVAWLDCAIQDVHAAGDHDIVVGSVDALGIAEGQDPLLFFQGGYGRMAPPSLSAKSDLGTVRLMRQIELVRSDIERIAAELDTEAIAVARRDGEMFIAASARTAQLRGVPTRVGQHIPLVPPLGAPLVAWADEATQDQWLASIPAGGSRPDYQAILARVRQRGWSVVTASPALTRFDASVMQMSVTSPTDAQVEELALACAALQPVDTDPEDLEALEHTVVRNIAAPVFDTDGSVAFIISLLRDRRLTASQLRAERDQILDAAARMTQQIAASDTDESSTI